MNTDAANDLVDVPSESEKLAISLDELLEEYLVLVDQYQTLRQELANALSKVSLHVFKRGPSNISSDRGRVSCLSRKPISQIKIAYDMGLITTMKE